VQEIYFVGWYSL